MVKKARVKKKIIIFSFIITLLFLLFLEVGSRLAYYIYSGSTNYLTYGFHSLFLKDQIDDDKKNKKIDNREIFRVACFGSSTTVGSGAQYGYPHYLQQYLQEKYPTKKIIVENFGMDGATHIEASYLLRSVVDMNIKPKFTAFSEKKQKRIVGPKRKSMIPNVVFLYTHGSATHTETMRLKKVLTEKEINNLRRITPEIALRGESWFRKLIYKIDYFLKFQSFLYYSMSRVIYWTKHNRYFYVLESINKKKNFLDRTVETLQLNSSKKQRYIKVSNLIESLKLSIYAAQKASVPIILGTVPFGRPIFKKNETLRLVHEANAKAINDTAQKRNVPSLDMLKIFKNDIKTQDFFVSDSVHLNDIGNKFVAKKLGDLIINNKYIN